MSSLRLVEGKKKRKRGREEKESKGLSFLIVFASFFSRNSSRICLSKLSYIFGEERDEISQVIGSYLLSSQILGSNLANPEICWNRYSFITHISLSIVICKKIGNIIYFFPSKDAQEQLIYGSWNYHIIDNLMNIQGHTRHPNKKINYKFNNNAPNTTIKKNVPPIPKFKRKVQT